MEHPMLDTLYHMEIGDFQKAGFEVSTSVFLGQKQSISMEFPCCPNKHESPQTKL